MKQSKIFNWLYFIILLLPIMLVFIPMINNYQPTVKNESVEIIDYGYNDFSLYNFYTSSDSQFHNFIFTDDFMNNVLFKYASSDYYYISFEIYDNLNLYDLHIMFEYTLGVDGIIFVDSFFSTGDADPDLITTIRDDTDNILGFGLSIQEWSIYDIENELFISPSCFLNVDGAQLVLPFNLSYKDYVITTEYNSIFYDFSVKMNDSFSFIGNFTEFINDNIIDLSTNDYVFFAWTYMIYILIISLLWLLISFLMFIIKWCYKFLGGIYEKI